MKYSLKMLLFFHLEGY